MLYIYGSSTPHIARDAVAPTITSATTVSVDSEEPLSHTLTANETVNWSIVGGTDSVGFELSSSTLRWAGNGTNDYLDPQDSDFDNDYVVTVRATDMWANTADQTITVSVEAAFGQMKFSTANNSGLLAAILGR